MAIEFIPKPATRKINLTDYGLYFAIVLLLAAVSLFLISLYAVKVANKTIDELKVSLAQEKTPERQALEGKMLDYQRKINDFEQLIDSHQFPSKFFSNLEDLTHPKLFFTGIALDSKEAKATFKGQADNFETLGQQILILKSFPLVKSYDLAKADLGKNEGIEFTLEVYFDPKIFK